MPSKVRYKYPLPERLVTAIEAIADPNQCAIAADLADMIGDTDRTRAILARCAAEADPLRAHCAAVRLAIRAVPVGKPRTLRPFKPWRAPLRLPSLLDNETLPVATPECETYIAPECVSDEELVAQLGAATLELDAQGDDAFLELVATPGFREKIAELKANPSAPPAVSLSELNLFRDFGIEIDSEPSKTFELEPEAPPSSRRRRRRAGCKPVGTDLTKMGQGDE